MVKIKLYGRPVQMERGTAPYKLVMQGDGNLVIYDKNGSVLWDRY